MSYFDGPGFGWYIDHDEFDSFGKPGNNGIPWSKKRGDGYWCSKCFDEGEYNWLDNDGKCKRHGVVERDEKLMAAR